MARWGEFYPDLKALLAALETRAPSYLRFNSLRGPPRETLRRLRAKGFALHESEVPGCVRVDEAPFSAGATTEYLLGRYFMQDLASQIAALALEPEPDWRIADLCAAPGGKTVALADLMHNRGAIAAFDPDPSRHRGLVANLGRCGVLNTATWQISGQAAGHLANQFDAVLLDAPCTGEGVIPRDPGRKQGQLVEYEKAARTQSELFAAAHRMLRPGGILLYATCTLAPEENEFQVDDAVAKFGFNIEELPQKVRTLRPNGNPLTPGLTKAGPRTLRPELAKTAHLLPHLHGCLGFYLARLRKEAP